MSNEEFGKEVGKYFLDISKLIFGGVVLASILKIENIDRTLTIFLGTVAAIGFAFIGLAFIKTKK